MFLLKLAVALAIVAACFVALFRLHRQLKGESGLGLEGREARRPKLDSNELEQFIAAYRRDKALGVAAPAASAATKPAASQTPAPALLPAAPPVEEQGKARPAFLVGSVKLAFLLLKAGLPDHHVFGNARISDLVDGNAVGADVDLKIDLLVCDKEMAVVAAVDVDSGSADRAADHQKQSRLQAAGIRYLRLAPGAFPRAMDVRRLIYGS